MTEQCPVCLHDAQRGRDRDYGDKKQVRCPRCGPFKISLTALAMLGSRIEQEPLARARLSHAIRSRTSEDNWLYVSSTNLGELAQQPLPSIPQQLQHLVTWISTEIGDDRFGRLPAPSLDSVAGLIGAVDSERVEKLIDYAVAEGVVERDADRSTLGLSPKGWTTLELPKVVVEPVEHGAPALTASENVKAHCNTCGGNRSALRHASHTAEDQNDEIVWRETLDILECGGCGGVFVRRTSWSASWDQIAYDTFTDQDLRPEEKVSYWPPQTLRKKPEWVFDLEDENLRSVIDEVYQALDHNLIILATIGTRTLLDRAMLLCVGDPKGGFAAKLNLMVQSGVIGINDKDKLKAITDAGNASAHRGYAPKLEMLLTIIAITEDFLHRTFVLGSAASEIMNSTPPR